MQAKKRAGLYFCFILFWQFCHVAGLLLDYNLTSFSALAFCYVKDLGSPSEKIWPGYNELPAVKKMSFTEYPYNNLRKRFGALLSDQGFDLMNK